MSRDTYNDYSSAKRSIDYLKNQEYDHCNEYYSSNKYTPEKASIILHNIPSDATESELKNLLKQYGCHSYTVKIIPFVMPLKAVVEFKEFEVARSFSSMCNGQLMVRDYPVVVELDMSLYKDPEFKHKDNSPCNILIFRGLDPSSTEEEIRQEVSSLVSDRICDLRLIRERNSTLSRGFCFVEMETTEAATNILKAISKIKPCFTIKSRRIAVSFARSTNPNISNDPNTKNVASNAIAAAQATRMSEKLVPVVDTSSNNCQALPKTIGNFQYDEKSGYYYDPSSGYCYNPVNGLYYYWSAETNQYIVFQPKTNEEPQEHPKKAAKVIKSSDSKKIMKNMESWAKKVNDSQKTKQTTSNISSIAQNSPEPSSILNDESLLDKNEHIDINLLACLLCQRKFTSKGILIKHLKGSELHKKNIENLTKQCSADTKQ